MANCNFDLFQVLSLSLSRARAKLRGSRRRGGDVTVCCRVNLFLKFLLTNRSFAFTLNSESFYARRARPWDNRDESRREVETAGSATICLKTDCPLARSINFALKATRNSVIPRRIELVPAVAVDENLWTLLIPAGRTSRSIASPLFETIAWLFVSRAKRVLSCVSFKFGGIVVRSFWPTPSN